MLESCILRNRTEVPGFVRWYRGAFLFLRVPFRKNEMNLELIFAASLVATYLAWYVCSLIPGRIPRGILRAAIIALLCSPGIIVGHGFAVVPSLFALYAQPSVWTLCSMLLIWIIVLGIVFSVPTLRNQRSAWPPSLHRGHLSQSLCTQIRLVRDRCRAADGGID